MRKTALLIALTAFPFLAYSQYAYLPDYSWGGNIGGSAADRAEHVMTDLYGDVIVAGKFFGPADFDILPSVNSVTGSGYFDSYISKYSPNGSLVWVKNIAANANSNETPYITSTATDSSGNIYVTGSFRGSVDFDPSTTATRILTSNGDLDAFILKLDRNGTLVWAYNIGSDESDSGGGIAVDSQDNVYVTGSFRKTADFDMTASVLNLTSEFTDSAFIMKLNKNGNTIWAKATQGMGSDRGISVAVDSNFNVFVTGMNYGTNDFDPSPAAVFSLGSTSNGQVYVWKLNSSGGFVNAGVTTPSDQTYVSRPTKIKIDSNDNVVIAGTFYGTIDFNFGPATNSLTCANNDAFVMKTDNNLNYLWARRLSSTLHGMVYGLAIDQNNNILSTGYMIGITVNDYSGRNGDEAYIWALNPAGQQIDMEDYVGNGDDEGRDITLDKAGNIYTVGNFNYNLKDMSIFSFNSNGNSDGFLMKLGSAALPAPAVLPPTAVNDAVSTSGSGSQTFNVAANDQGLSGTYTLNIVSYPSYGTLSANSNGTFSYVPNAGNPGTDSFRYTVENSNGMVSNVATVTVTAGSLGTQEAVAGQSMALYPNPAEDFLYIRSSQDVDAVTVFDRAGHRLYEIKGSRKIDVSALATGTYVLSVKMKNGETLHQSFIKK